MKSKISLLITSVLLAVSLSACMAPPMRGGYYYQMPHWEHHSFYRGWR